MKQLRGICNQLTAILIATFLFSCQSNIKDAPAALKKYSEYTDLEKMNLRGEVIGLKDIDNMRFYFFNDNGFIEKIIYYGEKDFINVGQIEDYLYSDHKLDKQIIKMNSSDESVVTNCIYNEQNQLIKKSMKWSIGESYSYYFYDNEKLIKDSSSSGFDIGKTGNFSRITNVKDYFYNNDTIVYIEEFNQNFYNEKVGTRSILKFKDEFGNFYESEKKKSGVQFEKDSKGNWVEKKWEVDGKGYSSNRVIFYKGQDISTFINQYDLFKTRKKLINENAKTSNSSNDGIIKSNTDEYFQPEKEEKINCSECGGSGQKICDKCYGKGETRCIICNGSGVSRDGRRCIYCSGGYEKCTRCYGKTRVRCDDCGGRGYKNY